MAFGTELVPGDAVHVFESQWDAFAFMDLSGERSGLIITRGATNGARVAGVIPDHATVYLWPKNDQPGEKCATPFPTPVRNCTMSHVKIPAAHKDLNAWPRTGASDQDM